MKKSIFITVLVSMIVFLTSCAGEGKFNMLGAHFESGNTIIVSYGGSLEGINFKLFSFPPEGEPKEHKIRSWTNNLMSTKLTIKYSGDIPDDYSAELRAYDGSFFKQKIKVR